MSELQETAQGEVSTEQRPYQEMVKHLLEMAKLDSEGSFEIAADVIDRIALATTPEEIFAANESGPEDAEDWLNQPIGITSVRWWPSAEKFKKGTLGVYAVFHFQTREGKEEIMSVGAPNVVATIYRLVRLDFINGVDPFWVVIRGRETPNGTLYTVHAAPDAG